MNIAYSYVNLVELIITIVRYNVFETWLYRIYYLI